MLKVKRYQSMEDRYMNVFHTTNKSNVFTQLNQNNLQYQYQDQVDPHHNKLGLAD